MCDVTSGFGSTHQRSRAATVSQAQVIRSLPHPNQCTMHSPPNPTAAVRCCGVCCSIPAAQPSMSAAAATYQLCVWGCRAAQDPLSCCCCWRAAAVSCCCVTAVSCCCVTAAVCSAIQCCISPPPRGPGCVLFPQPSYRPTPAWWHWCLAACAWQSPADLRFGGWGFGGLFGVSGIGKL